MKIAIILVSLFSLSLSLEATSIDYGQKVLFNLTNYEFSIPYKGPSKNIFLFLISHEKGKLEYEIVCPMIEISNNLTHKENGIIIYNDYGSCTLKFKVEEEDKGSFIVYDFKALYEIKLKNIYGKIDNEMGWTYTVQEENYDESISKLTFLVPNFRTNSTITFEYKEKVDIDTYVNPFKVCHENVCKENVTKYYFEKGKSYQIYVKIQKVSEFTNTVYAVPPFKFYAEDADEEYSNDDIKYTYNDTKPHSASNYRQVSMPILLLLTSLLI